MVNFSYMAVSQNEAKTWQALRLEGARDFPMGFLVTLEETAKTDHERCREILGAGHIRGVYFEENLVGFCGYRPQQLTRTKHRAEIGPFFITRDFQGKGAAQVLMNGVIEEAKTGGLSRLELFVDTENFRAIAFYERQGFERVATHIDGVRMEGQSRDDHFYILRLKH